METAALTTVRPRMRRIDQTLHLEYVDIDANTILQNAQNLTSIGHNGGWELRRSGAGAAFPTVKLPAEEATNTGEGIRES